MLVINNRFAYKGNVFKSLSAIANDITETKENKLKFFEVNVLLGSWALSLLSLLKTGLKKGKIEI